MSNRVPFDKKVLKYFIGYEDGKKFRPSCIMFSKMSAYRRDFGDAKYMYFLIKNYELLDQYNEFG